jgi:hypothetical protein
MVKTISDKRAAFLIRGRKKLKKNIHISVDNDLYHACRTVGIFKPYICHYPSVNFSQWIEEKMIGALIERKKVLQNTQNQKNDQSS